MHTLPEYSSKIIQWRGDDLNNLLYYLKLVFSLYMISSLIILVKLNDIIIKDFPLFEERPYCFLVLYFFSNEEALPAFSVNNNFFFYNFNFYLIIVNIAMIFPLTN